MVMQPTDLVRAARSLLVGSTSEGHRTKVPTIREKSFTFTCPFCIGNPFPGSPDALRALHAGASPTVLSAKISTTESNERKH